MSPFDPDTSTRRMHGMLVERTPKEPQLIDNALSKSHGILVGALLGVVAWVAIIVLGIAVWRWLR
jgi:hypothetical protein